MRVLVLRSPDRSRRRLRILVRGESGNEKESVLQLRCEGGGRAMKRNGRTGIRPQRHPCRRLGFLVEITRLDPGKHLHVLEDGAELERDGPSPLLGDSEARK